MLNKTIHEVSGPAPITMGKGPTKIIAPKLAEPPLKSAAEAKTAIMPAKIRMKPKIKNRKNLLGIGASSSAVCVFSSALFIVSIHLSNK